MREGEGGTLTLSRASTIRGWARRDEDVCVDGGDEDVVDDDVTEDEDAHVDDDGDKVILPMTDH